MTRWSIVADDTGTDWTATATEIEGFSCTNWECDHHECKFLRAAAVGLRRLAQLDTAESVGVDYCTLHHGIRNEDAHRCDMADDDLNPEYVFTTGQESVSYPNAGPDGEPRECVLVELIPRPAVLGSGEQPEGPTCPTCGSRSPMYAVRTPDNPWGDCTDSWHGGQR